MSDGCTGFQWLEAIWKIRPCCVWHDKGGTDGQLLDCLLAVTPDQIGVFVIICVAIMFALRPVYHLMKRMGLFKK